MSLIRGVALPTPYVAGAGPDVAQAARGRASFEISTTADAVRQTLQRRPARMAHADLVNPQAARFPRRVPLGLADASVGTQLDWPALPGRLPPGGLPPGVLMAPPPGSRS